LIDEKEMLSSTDCIYLASFEFGIGQDLGLAKVLSRAALTHDKPIQSG
jgi:hypothetical protein